MDAQIWQTFLEAVKSGYALPFIIFYLWEKHQEWQKKKSGDWVSWKHIQDQVNAFTAKVLSNERLLDFVKTQNDALRIAFDQRGKMLEEHFKAETEEKVTFAKIDADHKSLKESVKVENEHIFSQLKTIHEKLDSLTKIMLERRK